MQKAIWKKFIAIIMSAAMLFTMTGCGKKGDSSESGQAEADTKEMTYEGSELTISGMEGEPDSYFIKNDRIYIQTCQKIGDDGSSKENDEGKSNEISEETGEESYVEETMIYRLYTVNLDGNDLQEIPINLQEDEYISALLVGKDGSLTYMTSYNEKIEEAYNELIKIDANGNELMRENITESLKMGENTHVSSIVEDAKENVVVVSEQKVYILDKNFKSVGEVEREEGHHVIDTALTKDGEIVCVDEDYLSSQISMQVRILDVEGRKWGEPLKLDASGFSGNDYIMDGSGYDFYYKDDFGIYGYDLTSEKGTKLMDYTASCLTSEDADGIVPMGDGKFIGITYDYAKEEGKPGLVVYSKADPSTLANKKTITYGALMVSDDVNRAVMAFNRTNKDYQIVFKYVNEEDSYTRMLADVTAGNIPDIIDISNFPLSADQCVAKGLLEDLTPYYEKDSELKTDDIIDSVLEAMKTDEKLYYIVPGFSINTIVGKTKDVGDGTGWTFDELKALLKEKGEDVSLFDTQASKSEILDSLLEIADFVDWQSGECSFDSQDFKDILEICNDKGLNEEVEMSDAEIIEEVNSLPSRLREGKILLREGNSLVMEDVQKDKQIFGEDITYIGYPNREKQGSYFQFARQIGIYSESGVKDEAWEFIRTFMTKEYQGKIMNSYCTPTRKDCFDLQIKAKMATEAYTDEFGQEIEPLKDSWNWGSVEMELKPLSQEEVDMYVNLVNNAKKNDGFDEEIMTIVIEEAQAYFAGKKSLDKTADIIQRRVTTYVNEQR